MTFDWFTFVAQIVNFVVLIGLLNHFLYQPIMDAISKRESDFAEKVQAAQDREADAEAIRKRYESLNQEMESHRKMLLEQATEESNKAKKRLMQEARNEVQFRREDWLESLRNEQETVVNMLTQRSAAQVLTIANKALEQLADEELEQQTMQRFINFLSNLPESDRTKIQEEVAKPNSLRVETAFAINDAWKQKLRKQMQNQLGIDQIKFVQKPELVMGVSLRVGGLKLSWNVQDYIESLQEELQKVMKK